MGAGTTPEPIGCERGRLHGRERESGPWGGLSRRGAIVVYCFGRSGRETMQFSRLRCPSWPLKGRRDGDFLTETSGEKRDIHD